MAFHVLFLVVNVVIVSASTCSLSVTSETCGAGCAWCPSVNVISTTPPADSTTLLFSSTEGMTEPPSSPPTPSLMMITPENGVTDEMSMGEATTTTTTKLTKTTKTTTTTAPPTTTTTTTKGETTTSTSHFSSPSLPELSGMPNDERCDSIVDCQPCMLNSACCWTFGAFEGADSDNAGSCDFKVDAFSCVGGCDFRKRQASANVHQCVDAAQCSSVVSPSSNSGRNMASGRRAGTNGMVIGIIAAVAVGTCVVVALAGLVVRRRRKEGVLAGPPSSTPADRHGGTHSLSRRTHSTSRVSSAASTHQHSYSGSPYQTASTMKFETNTYTSSHSPYQTHVPVSQPAYESVSTPMAPTYTTATAAFRGNSTSHYDATTTPLYAPT
mmetsp:Transcript_2982/g.9757  ORF Transcript_2982/g.9757 Transcript_2982/m.9757 type:complete len:383 (-) Transcript_2982:79-1227(-)